MKSLSLEARVGLLVLGAGILLGAFVFVLADVRLKKGNEYYVDFRNPGAVQAGAPVRIGGIKVGRIDSVEYRGGRLDPATGRRPLVRMRVIIDDDVRETIHDDASFFITTQGVLGEQFIAVDPGSPERPVLRIGSAVAGIDPPRLDLALALGYELLETLTRALRENRELIGNLIADVSTTIHEIAELLRTNRGALDRIIANVETITRDATQLVTNIRERFVDGPQIRRILGNIDRVLTIVSRDLEPILRDVRSVAHRADETLGVIGPSERASLQGALAGASQLVERANATLSDTQEIVHHIREGRGTVGSFVMDEEIYDDVQELLRDLKHNPWKLFWRE